MRLKEIKLAGFKSFADTTTVVLPGNRSTVVGPNGCGKSNIVDAVRWVMGESSARQLRGEALSDVIFSGAHSRQPTALASVELLFDNRDGRVGGQFASYTDIAIRREVARDSPSTYFLNGTRCRRRDIADVFLGTGFGPRSYSIIEQGTISHLVEARPDELRAYLEEAAGVSKYRERRRETNNRIRDTTENLARLADIRDELQRQLGRLQRQAQAAERYRELKEQQRHRTAELHAIRVANLASQLGERAAAAQALSVEHGAALSAKQAVETALAVSRTAQGEQNDAILARQRDYYQVGADVSKLEEAMRFGQERNRQFKSDLRICAKRQEEAADQLAADMVRIVGMKEDIEAKQPDLARSEADEAAAAKRLEELEQQASTRTEAWEALAERISRNDGERHAAQQRSQYGERLCRRLRDRAAKLAATSAPAPDIDLEQFDRRIEDAAGKKRALALAIEQNAAAQVGARERVTTCERRLESVRREAQDLRGELAAVEAVQDAELRGAADAETEAWLVGENLHTTPRLGESLTVEPGWERAVEMVLGEQVRALPVADPTGFAVPLAELATGRLALVATSRERHVADGALPTLSTRVREALGSLALGVFTADSLTEALAHRASLVPGQSIVTPEGFWLGPDWLRLHKGDGESHGVIRRAAELESLRGAAARAEQAVRTRVDELTQVRDRLAALTSERESLLAGQAAAAAEHSRIEKERGIAQVRLEEAAAKARRDAAERESIDAELAQESATLRTTHERSSQLAAKADELDAQRDRLRLVREQEAAALANARLSARQTREACQRLRLEVQALTASLAATATNRDRLLAQRNDEETRADELRAAIAEIEAAIPAQQAALDTKLAKRLTIERALADERRRLQEIDIEIRALTGRRAEAERAAESLASQLAAVQVERERLAANRDNELTQLGKTGLTLVAAQRDLPEDANEEQWQEALAGLARRISRLGPINLAAIDEYETQSERKSYLDRQHQDLETALVALQDAIRRIDRDTRERFKDTFDRVNDHLKVLFPKVFGGGHAALELTGSDWLDTGVTLLARPPGKRNASIHSLSGGEKAMTAVALIFAIFELNPSPVCLLDEVDAPLDDTNVERFAALIREMSCDVQFVVVTHNKQTIEMADHLLGVTMEEPGVSRLVSVDVDKAARMAAAG